MKHLTNTSGMTFILGCVGTGILLLGLMIKWPIIDIIGAAGGILSSGVGASVYIFVLIQHAVYPGIFIVMLILAKNENKRGKTFGIVWFVISLICLIVDLINFAEYNSGSMLNTFSYALMPPQLKMATTVSIFGNGLILASTILFFLKIRQETGGAPLKAAVPHIPFQNKGDGVKCTKCGQVLKANTIFCPECGAKKGE